MVWPVDYFRYRIALRRTRRALRQWAPRTHKYSPVTFSIYLVGLVTIIGYALLRWLLYAPGSWLTLELPTILVIVTFLLERGALYLKDGAAKFIPGALPMFTVVEYKRGQHVREIMFNGVRKIMEMARVGGFWSGMAENTGPIFLFSCFKFAEARRALAAYLREALKNVGVDDATISKLDAALVTNEEDREEGDAELVTGTLLIGKHVFAPHKWRPYVYISDEDEKRYRVSCHIPTDLKRWLESVYNGTDEPKVHTGTWVFISYEPMNLATMRPRVEDAKTEDVIAYWQSRAKELENENQKLREKEAMILELQAEAMAEYGASQPSEE